MRRGDNVVIEWKQALKEFRIIDFFDEKEAIFLTNGHIYVIVYLSTDDRPSTISQVHINDDTGAIITIGTGTTSIFKVVPKQDSAVIRKENQTYTFPIYQWITPTRVFIGTVENGYYVNKTGNKWVLESDPTIHVEMPSRSEFQGIETLSQPAFETIFNYLDNKTLYRFCSSGIEFSRKCMESDEILWYNRIVRQYGQPLIDRLKVDSWIRWYLSPEARYLSEIYLENIYTMPEQYYPVIKEYLMSIVSQAAKLIEKYEIVGMSGPLYRFVAFLLGRPGPVELDTLLLGINGLQQHATDDIIIIGRDGLAITYDDIISAFTEINTRLQFQQLLSLHKDMSVDEILILSEHKAIFSWEL